MQGSAIRNEFALSQSHQAQVTKDLQHDSACCEQSIRSVYDAIKMSQNAKKGPHSEQTDKKVALTRWKLDGRGVVMDTRWDGRDGLASNGCE